MNSTIRYMYNGEELVLNVQRRIGFVEIEDIIDTIVDGVFVNGKYMPSRFDYYMYACILSKYTDFDFEQYSTDDIYNIIDDEAFVNLLNDKVCSNQRYRILSSANECIRVKLDEHPLKNIADKFNDLMESGGDIIQNLANNKEFRDTLTKYVADQDAKNVIRMFDNAIGATER